MIARLVRRARRYRRHLGVAMHNLVVMLITPPTVRADEQAAREFAARMREMDCDPAEELHTAAMFAAAGMSERDVMVFAKIAATRAVSTEALWQLVDHGYRLGFTPHRLNENHQASTALAADHGRDREH